MKTCEMHMVTHMRYYTKTTEEPNNTVRDLFMFKISDKNIWRTVN